MADETPVQSTYFSNQHNLAQDRPLTRREGRLAELDRASWRASTWVEGAWKVLAWFGVVLSVVAVLIIVAVFGLRVLVENSDLMDGNSKQRKSRKSGGRRGRRRRYY